MPKYNKNQYSLRQVYAWYKKQVKIPVDYKKFKLILDTWGKKVNEYIVAGKDVRLQQGLSTLGVRKNESAGYVDRLESKKQKKRVLLPNTHSNFYVAYTYWRSHYTTFNSRGWTFKPTRELARAIAKKMKEPFGHTTFGKRAMVARSTTKGQKFTNRKIHKL